MTSDPKVTLGIGHVGGGTISTAVSSDRTEPEPVDCYLHLVPPDALLLQKVPSALITLAATIVRAYVSTPAPAASIDPR